MLKPKIQEKQQLQKFQLLVQVQETIGRDTRKILIEKTLEVFESREEAIEEYEALLDELLDDE